MRVPGFRFVQAKGDYADKDGLHYGFAIHATANTASDEAETAYAAHRTDGTSAHGYVDWDSLTQALDTDRKAGHAGSAYGNENAIAIEFTGLNSYTRQRWLDSIAWSQVGAWIAYILRNDPDYRGFQVRRAGVDEMRANPRVKAFYGHDDMRRAWGGTDHTDPGPNFPWDRLFQAVNDALGGAPATTTSGDDMGFNANQKADAAFNLKPRATLDTDGSDNGAGALAEFDSPLYLAFKNLADRLAALEQRPPGGSVPVDVDAVAELAAGKLVKRLEA